MYFFQKLTLDCGDPQDRHKDSGSVRKGVCESPQGKECKLVTHIVGWLLLRVEQEQGHRGTACSRALGAKLVLLELIPQS